VKKLGRKIKIEIILSIIFLLVPIILPLSSGVLQPSISEYHYTSGRLPYIILLGIIGLLTLVDGLNKERRYNIIIGLSMIGVVCFPVNEFRILHDVFAIIFFVGNAFIVTYYSNSLSKIKKIMFAILIMVSLTLLLLDIINIFVAESIGMFSMSYFMLAKHSFVKLNENVIV
jgi:hypothetical protein